MFVAHSTASLYFLSPWQRGTEKGEGPRRGTLECAGRWGGENLSRDWQSTSRLREPSATARLGKRDSELRVKAKREGIK